LTETVQGQEFESLAALIGKERSLNNVTQALHFFATALRPKTVGAVHVTCADESEMECVEAFQTGFAHYLLPPLKFARRALMRLANLGGQYEWGTIRIADAHYRAPDGFKLIVVKINGHVGVQSGGDFLPGEAPRVRSRLGMLRRYDSDSPCCGALDALLNGATQPFTEGLRELFGSEGLDRQAILGDPDRVAPEHRMLVGALTAARLQTRKAVLDIQDFEGTEPAYWLVIGSVTLNRSARDTEIVTGFYAVDARRGDRTPRYFGLSDNPASYWIDEPIHGFAIEDDSFSTDRPGRDHRALALRRLREIESEPPADDGLPHPVREELRSAGKGRPLDGHRARALLRMALPVLAEVAPVPAAIILFAEGAAGINHAFRVGALTDEINADAEARKVLEDMHAEIDRLDSAKAEALVRLLSEEYS